MKTRDKLMMLYSHIRFQIILFCWALLLGLLVFMGGSPNKILMITGGIIVFFSVVGIIETCKDLKRVGVWVKKIESGYGKNNENV